MDKTLRSPLFLPCSEQRFLDKAAELTPDALVPDLEDSVPENAKDSARSRLDQCLPKLLECGRPIIPRVNPLESPYFLDDLKCSIRPGVAAISVGKIRSPRQIEEITAVISDVESTNGVSANSIGLIPVIESAEGVLNAAAIAASSDRIVAITFGAEDYCHDLAITRSPSESELEFARSMLGVAARAANVPALESPYTLLGDESGLKRYALQARQRGFSGQFAIHPEQINGINEVFSPTVEQIDWAKRILRAFSEAERSGAGAARFEGKMIDAPVKKQAEQILGIT